MFNKKIEVTHENGYTGILYGKRSMSITKGGKEVIHTGSRDKNIQTKEDLYKILENVPGLMKSIDKMFDDLEVK